jgi:Tol biopolymer transport system component
MIGARLGPYEITAKLGAGGMGEVYRALDTRLGREVALKFLPADFAEDPERHARFEREAKTLASLNHPHIAVLYGLEHLDGHHALAMELVEGEGLDERIARGPVQIDEALPIAMQIAEGLEAAHEKGIVHRDLKPANVKVRPDGTVKLLDFGLAKAWEEQVEESDPAHSPTVTGVYTKAGVILGTAAYMSPEQARGKPVDKRTDIWAFGCLLYEILTGGPPFQGDTVTDVMSAIVTREPDWEALPAALPQRARMMLRRCLEKDPKRRLRDIGEARIALETVAAREDDSAVAMPLPSATRRGIPLPAFLATLAVVIPLTALLATRWLKPSTQAAAAAAVTEFSVPVEGLVDVALSPDGRRLSWLTRGGLAGDSAPWSTEQASVMRRLWVRDLGDRTPREVVHDEALGRWFFSLDGSQLVAEIGDQLWRVPAAGGERTPVCTLPKPEGIPARRILTGVWLPDDTLLFAMWRGGIYRVPARGGDPRLFLPIDPKVDVDFHRIIPLPDGRSFILAVHRQRDSANPKSSDWERLELLRDGRRETLPGGEALLDSEPIGFADGLLPIERPEENASEIWGLPLEAGRWRVAGEKILLVPRAGAAAVGADGTIAYVLASDQPGTVARVDRSGQQVGQLGGPNPHLDGQALSPDGSRLAVVLNGTQLWVRDLRRGTLTRIWTADDSIEEPQWSADGESIYYSLDDTYHFERIRAEPGTTPQTVLEDAVRAYLTPDGNGLLLHQGSFDLTEEQGLYWAPFDAQGRPGPRRKLIDGVNVYGRLAPGGRLFAYDDVVAGQREVFLGTFPKADQKLQLSANGGFDPQWSANGKTVYYLSGRALVEVEVGIDGAGRLTASRERTLFDLDRLGLRLEGWSPAPDGNSFLFLKSLAGGHGDEIVVVCNGVQRALAEKR